MFFWEAEGINPYENLAFEEYLLEHSLNRDEEHCYLWQNENTVVIGKYQNIREEVNEEYARKHNVHVVRRNSGGGAVFHDKGNLNYTFIRQRTKQSQEFSEILVPVLEVLRTYGIPAVCLGRNDILVNRKKVSGNSQYIIGDKILLHGTLLLSSDLSALGKVLSNSNKHISSNSTKSVTSRVCKIADCTSQSISMEQIKKDILLQLSKNEKVEKGIVTDSMRRSIKELARNKYESWEWNYGKTPAYNIKRERRFSAGTVRVLMQVGEGKIDQIHFEGDFITGREVEELEEFLTGLELSRELLGAVKAVNVGDYIHGLTNIELCELLIGDLYLQ